MNPDLIGYIADIRDALTAFRASSNADITSIEVFFLDRCFHKFTSRFNDDRRICNRKRLFHVIDLGIAANGEATEVPIRSNIETPAWLDQLWEMCEKSPGGIKGETTKSWASLLSCLLFNLDEAIKKVKGVNGKNKEERRAKEMITLNDWCRMLYLLTHWEGDMVQGLLKKTEILHASDVEGDQALLYLEMATALHAAVHHVFNQNIHPELLKHAEIAVVEEPPSRNSILSLGQISKAFVARYSDMEAYKDVLESLSDYPKKFRGCFHAEATLMGLLNHYVVDEKPDVALIATPDVAGYIIKPVCCFPCPSFLLLTFRQDDKSPRRTGQEGTCRRNCNCL